MAVTTLPEVWRDLYLMLGAVAATIVGLLFVVMSLHMEAIKNRDRYDAAAVVHAGRNNTFHLLNVFLISVLVVMPQPSAWLGLEIAAINGFGLRLPVGFTIRHFGRSISVDHRQAFPMDTIMTIAAGYLLGLVGGVALAFGEPWGLQLVTVSCAILLIRTVLTAWGLIFGSAQAAAKAKAS